MKSIFREQAIALRRTGLSYSEILSRVPIAKSTLSTWLQDVGLSKKQKHRLTAKMLASAHRGGAARHEQRLIRTAEIMSKARTEIGRISRRELWLIGTALFWAEGTKEKPYRSSAEVRFSNSDIRMVKVFLRWLQEICNVSREDIAFSLFVHENHTYRLSEIQSHWAVKTGWPQDAFQRVYFKKNHPKTQRKNIGEAYFGVVQVRVRTSSTLIRKIAGWTEGVIESLR